MQFASLKKRLDCNCHEFGSWLSWSMETKLGIYGDENEYV